MSSPIIAKDQIQEMLVSWMTEYRLVAPAMDKGKLIFKEIEDISELVISDEIPYKSPKEFLFPQLQKLMTFDSSGELILHEDSPKTIIFGIKPCDLDTLKILKAVFTEGQHADPYFIRAMENTVFIGIGCLAEKPGCFCKERGIEKDRSTACDIFLREDQGQYQVEVMSETGRALLEDRFSAPIPLTHTAGVREGADAASADGNILEIQADEARVFNEVDWEKIAERCMGCGICTYVCPTCHCFAFKDVKTKEGSSRYRVWDSCMYPKFTLHASGHNPRASKKERFRQRVMHKYVYLKKNVGYTACSGCGRCIRSCPAGMNIKSVVSGIMEELK